MTSGPEAVPGTRAGARDTLRVAVGAIGLRGAIAVLRRPALWITAVRVGARLVPTRWWARRPHLPVPDPAYLRFRMVTAYGGEGDSAIAPRDLVDYLEWARSWPSAVRDTG